MNLKLDHLKVTVTARVKAREGMEEQVTRECLALVALSRADTGCINYDLYQSADNHGDFIFHEEWASREDLERHLGTPHSLLFDERIEGMLDGPEEVTFWEVLNYGAGRVIEGASRPDVVADEESKPKGREVSRANASKFVSS